MRSIRVFASWLLAIAFLLPGVARAGADAEAGDDRAPRTTGSTADPVAWNIDKAHSQVQFKVRHLGLSTVTGSFSDYDVAISFDPADLTTLQVRAEVDVNSIDTGVERRDNHLRSEDFFHAEVHPTLTFVATEVRDVAGDRFKLAGDLTMRGTTKPVVLDARLVGVVGQGEGKQRAVFEAGTTIDRMDYGLKWDRLTEAGGLVVSREVEIVLNVAVTR